MSLLKDFRAFAMKGSVIELAVAVIIAAAFGAIISSLVDDVITPLLLAPALKAANAQDLSELSWRAVKYGKFIAAIIKFILVAFILFLVVRSLVKKKEIIDAGPSSTDILLMQIRDELKMR